jgi:hypothetical protein
MSWVETLIESHIDSTALTASTTRTSILPAAAIYTMPANFIYRIGQRFRVRAWGRISTVVTTPGTLLLDIGLGAAVAFNGGAMALNVVAKVDVCWSLDVELTVRAIGPSANMHGQGEWKSEAVIGSPLPTAGGSGVHLLPFNTAPVVGANFDSGAALAWNLFGTWSVNNAANSVLTHQYCLQHLTA